MNSRYQQLLKQKVIEQWHDWQGKLVSEHELYRFLHTIKGTSGTIDMQPLSHWCAETLQTLNESSEEPISKTQFKELRSMMIKQLDQHEISNNQPTSSHSKSSDSFLLIVDQDVAFASTLKDLLESSGYSTMIADTGKKGIEMFYTLHPKLVIVDLHNLDMEGSQFLAQIDPMAKSRFIPIVVLGENLSNTERIEAWKNGALDVISKPLQQDIFLSYIESRFEFQRSILQSTMTDALTGASNRRQFDLSLPQQIHIAEEMNRPFSFVLLDLDFFKKVNDSYGHIKGDEVLQQFSQTVRGTIRNTDLFFRYGGEEFALMLPAATAEEAELLIQRIRHQFAQIAFYSDEGKPFHVTFSAGIAVFQNNEQTLVEEADQALYQAKQNGRNRTTIYSKQLPDFIKKAVHICIIDDAATVRAVLHEQFLKLDTTYTMHIHEYEDGRSFIESDWYRESEKYVLLLDGMMPRMDGLDVLRHLREHYPKQNLLITMLTARANEADIIRALKDGADDYMIKPFHPLEVAVRVEKLIERFYF